LSKVRSYSRKFCDHLRAVQLPMYPSSYIATGCERAVGARRGLEHSSSTAFMKTARQRWPVVLCTVTDIDECRRGRRVCSERQRCVNTEGSYTCEGPSGPATDQPDQCPRGYAEDPHTRRCEGSYSKISPIPVWPKAGIPRRRHGHGHRHLREDRRENVGVSFSLPQE